MRRGKSWCWMEWKSREKRRGKKKKKTWKMGLLLLVVVEGSKQQTTAKQPAKKNQVIDMERLWGIVPTKYSSSSSSSGQS